MHYYVHQVIGRIQAEKSNGRGGYLRIHPEADQSRAHAWLTEERDAAQAEVESLRMPPQLVCSSMPMQILILTELLLSKPQPIDPIGLMLFGSPEPEQPVVDILAVSMAQGIAPGRIAERIEEAARDLVMMAPRLLQIVATL